MPTYGVLLNVFTYLFTYLLKEANFTEFQLTKIMQIELYILKMRAIKMASVFGPPCVSIYINCLPDNNLPS